MNNLCNEINLTDTVSGCLSLDEIRKEIVLRQLYV